jgi:glutamine amidotransferase
VLTTIVNLGAGNLGSVPNMLRRLGLEAAITADPDDVAKAERLVLPGVGSFDAAVAGLDGTDGLRQALDDAIGRGTPVLGICLGMQLLADGSDEGGLPGLGWVPGRCRRLPEAGADGPIRVPHIGWSTLTVRRPSPVFPDDAADARFYFAHSFHLEPDDADDVLAVARYGIDFVAAVARDNVLGVQFHPEKSHRHGMAVLAGFVGAS